MTRVMSTVLTFEEFSRSLPDLPTHERSLIRQAFDTAQQAHAGQKRRSGEDYFVHCFEVARILAELGLDATSIAAGLLHDVVEDTDVTLEDVERQFGEEIAGLVHGVTKLADRLHNLRTLGHLSQDRQQGIARETMDIFAPLANRLGIWQTKWELEDLSFRYLEPDRYKMIASLLAERRADREYYLDQVVQRVQKLLKEHGIEADVSGRSKHIHSIWRKMERKTVPFDQISDVRAVRVIVSDIPTCYQVLGIIHQTWRPIAGEFDDYIAAPKDNFYQSLHTAVFLEDSKTLEVQIRTFDMHTHAEYGIEFLETLRNDVFQDRVYVFTPRGDIIDLPYGSTPIDFAYHIHTDIGHRCRGAKANGKLVPLDYVLEVGDRVEIVTAKRGGPSRDWLNPSLGYVKTRRALSKIRLWFRKQDQDKMVAQGREILDRELKRLGLDQRMSHEQVAGLLGFDKVDDMLAQIGFGDVHPQQIANKILELEQQAQPEEELLAATGAPLDQPVRGEGISIQGTGGLLTTLARCCNPVQGDEIIGYITRGKGVTVHRRDCVNVHNLAHERLIAVEWSEQKPEMIHYPVAVMISAYDREGLLRDIAAAVAEEHINMRDVTVKTHNHIATFYVTMEVESAAQLSRVLTKIEHLPNVMEARRRTV